MLKIVLDTNFLMIPHKFKIDIFAELEKIIPAKYELIVMERTITELKNLNNPAAKVGLELLNMYKDQIKIVENTCYVDEAIMKFSEKNAKDTIVCTNDKELKKKLKKQKINIICLKNKSKIDFE